jgi:hypothetical protein
VGGGQHSDRETERDNPEGVAGGLFRSSDVDAEHPLSWAAFWLMNGRSILRPQTSIEIDVVEHKGWETDLYGAYLHEWGTPGEHHEGAGVPTRVDVTQGYFRYGMLVEAGVCAPFFERMPVLSSNGRPLRWTLGRSGEMDRDDDVFWLLLTLALRSDVPFPSPLRPEDHEAHLRIDYVRVYG